jgi:hypothetical protein
MNLILLGAIATSCFVISLFFLRYWKTTHDRFFLFFAISFLIEGVNRLVNGLTQFSDEQQPVIYIIRLIAFLVIFYAILDKNRRKKT